MKNKNDDERAFVAKKPEICSIFKYSPNTTELGLIRIGVRGELVIGAKIFFPRTKQNIPRSTKFTFWIRTSHNSVHCLTPEVLVGQTMGKNREESGETVSPRVVQRGAVRYRGVLIVILQKFCKKIKFMLEKLVKYV